MSFEEFFQDGDNFGRSLLKKIERMMHEKDQASGNRRLTGQWTINRIDEDNVKGYAVPFLSFSTP